jgi:mRNA interferase MazF
MGTFVKGDVVVIPFPFSDLSATKRRPELVVAVLPGDDVILCQITSQSVTSAHAVSITASDFATRSLHQDSNVRPERLFTADSGIIAYQVGHLQPAKMQEVITSITQIITT